VQPLQRPWGRNPNAWFRTNGAATEIATVRPRTGYIGFPYPKYMTAIIEWIRRPPC